MQSKYSRDQAGQEPENAGQGDDRHDPLQELVAIVDDGDEIPVIDNDRFGRRRDAAIDGLDDLLIELQGRPPSRLSMLMHRVAQSLMALRGLHAAGADPWKAGRVPEAHWRALADEALGLLSEAARKELEEQRLIASMPEEERNSFQKLCDSRRGLGVFRKGFEKQREAWEQAYWRRALDESFGRTAWTGPGGGKSAGC